MLTQEEIKAALYYDRFGGKFYWRRGSQRVRPWQEAGTKMRSGHMRIKLFGKDYLAHRLAWVYEYGTEPPALVDHRDRDPANNSIANLRLATKAQNGQNRTATGVSFHKATGKWRAYITHEGVTNHLGVFDDLSAALTARRTAARALWTHFSKTDQGEQP